MHLWGCIVSAPRLSPPHAHERKHHGKFDCWADERVHEIISEGLYGGEEGGNVEAPTGWYAALTLDAECAGHEHDPSRPDSVAGETIFCDGSCTPDWRLLEHYGSPYLIVRENSQGFFWVAVHTTEERRDEHLDELEAAYREWEES